MTLELRILLCSFTVSMPLLLLHYRSDPAYRVSSTSTAVVVMLFLLGLYQAIAGVRIACIELQTEHWLQYVVMFLLFSAYCCIMMIPEFQYAPAEEDDGQ